MVFWIFKKREADIDKRLKAYMNPIETSLKHSFSRIKTDMLVLSKQQNRLFAGQSNHQELLHEILERIELLESQLNITPQEHANSSSLNQDTHETPVPAKTTGRPLETPLNPTLWDALTPVQKAIISKIGLLMVEGSQESVPIKYLAEELYPKKGYEDVRSMLSTYIDILIEFGLLAKKRKGRQTYVFLTDKGMGFQDQLTKKKLKKPIKQQE